MDNTRRAKKLPLHDSIRNQLPGFSQTRRTLMLGAGAAFGSTLLGSLSACGGGGGTSTATDNTATAATDPIWGVNGAATAITSSLRHITQAAFPAADFVVTSFGARTCAVVAATSPYDPVKSPVSDGAGTTTVPNAFDSRPAFQAAIQACNAAGGGRVVVPSGDWYCAGPIVLLSNVNFHLSANCTIYFSPLPDDYAKDGPLDCGANGKLYYSRWQANDCLNYGSPIYAYQQSNIALTGEGASSILNGQAMTPFAGSGTASSCWWTFKGSSGAYGCVSSATPSQAFNNPNNLDLKTLAPTISPALYALLTNPVTPWQQDQNYLPALSEAGVPVTSRIFGKGHYLRPCMVEFIGCTNVLMDSYQTNNTPFWQHHPTNCKNVVILNVFANSIGPNNDGFDPDACNNVRCDGMTFNTGDDCIAVKSGKDLDIEYGAAQNHVITNCTMNSGHGGITFGSEMSGGISNMYVRNLVMLNQNWATNSLNIAIRIKTNLNRGGSVKDIYVDNVTLAHGVSLKPGGYSSTYLAGSPINATVPLGVVTAAAANPSASQGGIITMDCDYQPSSAAIRTRPPVVQNINISNVTATNVVLGGVTASCFQAIVAQGPVKFDYNGSGPIPPVPAITGVTISNCDFGAPVAVGPATATVPGPVYAYNVNSIALKNVTIGGQVYNTTVTDLR